MSSEHNGPMVEKPSTPIGDDSVKEPAVSNDPDEGAPQQGEGASPDEKPKFPRLSDPYENEPKLEGDPFAHLFNVLSKKDMDQCKAWEEEVQNILIFAALFSAVVTAFIIDSYKRLQPDPNHVMVNLLAHIAQRMDGEPLNGTSPVSSILSGNNFVPTQADIRINVAWFISLVLSLTAALIGIVTLQWLREHRQSRSWTPKDKLGILNMRMQSLERWYVPQIFASLPLIVQGSLVFFFAGVIEFLFGLDTKVATAVTAFISIPLMFLLLTTIFPLLQVCFLLLPFGLPIHAGVPSPCPYKSPQSMIIWRVGTIFTWFVRECDKWSTVARYRPPAVNRILSSADWAGMDRKWLAIRANYATLPHMLPHKSVNSLLACLQTLDQDAVLVFRRVMNLDLAETDTTALYHCMNAVYSKLAEDVLNLKLRQFGKVTDRLASSIVALIPHKANSDGMDDEFNTETFVRPILTNISTGSDGKGLLSATLLSISFTRLPLSSTPKLLLSLLRQVAARMILEKLTMAPEALFSLRSVNRWFPRTLFFSDFVIGGPPDPIILEHATSLFHNFLEKCAQPHPVTTLWPDEQSYAAVERFMYAVVYGQSIEDANLTLVLLKSLCNNTTPRERPFLFLAACFYLDRVSFCHTGILRGLNPPLRPSRDELLDLLCLQCSVTERGFKDWIGEWLGLQEAVKNIYDANTNTPGGQEPPQIETDIPETRPKANPTIEFNPDASSEV